ncbi:MAG TPA: Clp protease N-terminal domain-containing protein [Streptosporangiaceae bacterium]|nr:Clp protease N-terminal domain-containing protein [Streptosporangiaceae bacterium]
MPKINVYLPDELAVAVRAAGVPVSAVCQYALSEAVTGVTRARRAADAIRDPGLTSAIATRLSIGVGNRMTDRLRTAIGLARHRGEPAGTGPVSTGGLLLGLLDEGGNLAVSILQSLDTDLDELRESAEGALSQAEPVAPGQAPGPDAAGAEGESAGASWQLRDLTMPARNAVASAIEAGVSLGHNYVGAEHLLLGLLDPAAAEASQAGRALAALGVTAADVSRALKGTIAGVAHGRTLGDSASAGTVTALVARLEAIERRLSAIGG